MYCIELRGAYALCTPTAPFVPATQVMAPVSAEPEWDPVIGIGKYGRGVGGKLYRHIC
jgi:hypothetical protein